MILFNNLFLRNSGKIYFDCLGWASSRKKCLVTISVLPWQRCCLLHSKQIKVVRTSHLSSEYQMFSVKENDCVGFDSKWKVKRIFTEGTSQTTEYSLAEISTNTASTTTAETQTCDDASKNKVPEVDMQRLAEWLKKICPNVERELNESINSKAFNGCYSFEESESPDAKLLQTLNVSFVDSSDGDPAVRVCALAWNSTGNTLAVSCNRFHKTWCHHSGQINFYSFDRNDKLPDLPHKKLTTAACVGILRFHPSIPSVIACGTYSGEIIVWNIQHDDGDNVVAKLNAHEEGITDMAWIHDIDATKSLLLVTSSLDGYLNLWNFSLPSSSLTIKQKYKIKSPAFARFQRPSGLPEEISKKIARGILSFDFSAYIPDMFAVGVEGGLVAQCSMLGTTPLKGGTKEAPISNPVFKYYEPHDGEINTVRFSPNRRDMFMTNGSEGEIRIYLIGQDAPARVIFMDKQLNQVSWVPYQEKLITGCGEKGIIDIFHLISGRPLPNVTSEKVVQTTLLQMEVNKQRCTTVAVGNDRGELQLWTVPWGLFALQKQ